MSLLPALTPADLSAVLLLGVACWGLRVLFVLLVPADRLPAAAVEALRYLAPAAIASICAVELTGALESADPASAVASVAIVGCAAAVAVLTRSMSWATVAGIVAVLSVDVLLLPT